MSKKKTPDTEPQTPVEETEVSAPVEQLQDTKKDPVELLKEEVEALNDKLLRNQAELQNFKRRNNEERIKDRIYANIELIKKLLTPLDHFELGLKSEATNKTVNPHLKGFELIRNTLFEALEEEGLEAIDPLGDPFDPKFHQAVAKETKEDVEPNTIIEVYQKGYLYKDRLIRPAMVKVSEE